MDNYRKEVIKSAEDILKRQNEAKERPGVYHIMVAHDNWCNFLNGKGECNCNPETITEKLS